MKFMINDFIHRETFTKLKTPKKLKKDIEFNKVINEIYYAK